MSQSGLQYAMQESFSSNERLLVHYEFSGMSGRTIGNTQLAGPSSSNHSVIENCDPALNTGLYSGILPAGYATSSLAKEFTTGTVLVDNNLNLGRSNIIVESSGSNFFIDFKKVSTLFDFQFDGEVQDFILFGSLEKTSTTVNSEVITGAKGYNFGINSRGKMFYQSFDKRGDFIYTANSIDLAKRNVVGFSLGENVLSLSRFDYLNNNIETETFNIDTSFISQKNERFYLGGSQQYFRGGSAGPSGEFKTVSQTEPVRVNSFCLLSGYIGPSLGLRIGSGLIGTFFESSTTATEKEIVTGYKQITTFKTGITGYEYEVTGNLDISTGQYMLTGEIVADGTVNKKEGELFFQYDTFELNGVTTFNKEQVGFLHPLSGYQYLPTGDGAFDTLGLQDVEGAVSNFIEREGVSGSQTISVKLYASKALAGDLPEVSGVRQVPLLQTVVDIPSVNTSGVDLSVPSDLFKKDYIYYKGVRK